MLSIRFQIIVLSVFALTFLGILILKEYNDVQTNLQDAKNNLKIIHKITQLSNTMTSLQKERGSSASYLVRSNPDRHETLREKRDLTNALLKELSYLSCLDTNQAFLLNEKLKSIRLKIDSHAASWDDVKDIYTSIIEELLTQTHTSIKSLEYTKEVKNKLTAISHLAYARENLAFLRATISRYYKKELLTDGESVDIIKRYFGFESSYKSFLLSQDATTVQKLENEIGTDIFDTVQSQVELILRKEFNSLSGSTLQWWHKSTSIIEVMLQVEKDFLNEVHQFSSKNIEKSKQNLFIYSSTAFSIFAIISLLAIFTVFRIFKIISHLINTLREVENTENFELRINYSSKDELGQLSNSINKLLNYTNSLIKHKDELASRDLLTGILNRRSFLIAIDSEIKRHLRYNTKLSLIFCDIDNFKLINDTYGHNIGDKVLQSFSKSVQSNIRQTDLFARWGGEEFVILTVETNKEDASQVAENLRKNIMEIKIEPIEQFTCSFGVAELKKDESFEELCERADEALYEAKESGRNKVCISQG